MYWKVMNMEMNLWELAIHLMILKDCVAILYSLQPTVGTPNRSRLGAQIMALKHTKKELFVFFYCNCLGYNFQMTGIGSLDSAKYCQAPQEFCQPHHQY
jgi:hypothetical protein